MSIPPLDANSPVSCAAPSSPVFPSPSFSHGSPPQQQQERQERQLRHSHPAQRLVPVAEAGAPEEGSDCVTVESSSDSVANFSEVSTEVSHSVTEIRTDDLKNGSHNVKNDTKFHDHSATSRVLLSSCIQSDTNYSGKFSGSASSMHSHRLSGGSRILHQNASQFGTRRAQIVNGNHLLNFHYDPIQRSQPRMPPPKRQQKVKPFNRDLFLQANYSFIVLDTGNYAIELINPDKMLRWEDIVCVRYSSSYPVQCPICLESPLCPQITSCGHIYCFPCILRHLIGEDDHKGDYWKKCPLCFMMISLKDLYTVSVDHVREYCVGDEASFILLTRPKGSFVPSQKNLLVAGSVPYDDNFVESFSKFSLTTDVELSVREAKSHLQDWLCKSEHGQVDDMERLPYVYAALEQLELRMKGWAEHQAVNEYLIKCPVKSKAVRVSSTIPSQDSFASASVNGVSIATQDKRAKIHSTVKNAESGEIKLMMPSGTGRTSENLKSIHKLQSSLDDDTIQVSSSGSKDEYLFYQASDGQHLILHPLNMRCLLHHYKNTDLLPPRISGKILQLETVTQSEETRRRFRFLNHFSLTTTFQFCEIDLRETLPPDAFSPVIGEIRKREKQRRKLAEKEKAEKARNDAVSCSVPIHRQILDGNAAFTLDDFEALGSSSASSTSPPLLGERKLFSDVTRLGYAAAHDSPSLRSEMCIEIPSAVEGSSTPTLSYASVMATSKAVVNLENTRNIGSGKKGKKPSVVLLSTAGGRRY